MIASNMDTVGTFEMAKVLAQVNRDFELSIVIFCVLCRHVYASSYLCTA